MSYKVQKVAFSISTIAPSSSVLTNFEFAFKQVYEIVVKKITSVQVESLPDLLQTSSVVGSATQNPSTVSDKCLVSTVRFTFK